MAQFQHVLKFNMSQLLSSLITVKKSWVLKYQYFGRELTIFIRVTLKLTANY